MNLFQTFCLNTNVIDCSVAPSVDQPVIYLSANQCLAESISITSWAIKNFKAHLKAFKDLRVIAHA